MRLSTVSLARASARRPWRAIGAWGVALLVAVACIALLLGDALTTEGDITSNPESKQAERLIRENASPSDPFDELVVIRHETLTVDSDAFRRFAEELVAAGARTGAVADARSFWSSGDPSLVSEDRHATLIPIVMGPGGDDNIDAVIAVVRGADGRDGFAAAITGTFTTDRDFLQVSNDDLQRGELSIGLPAALVVLVLVFGALVSALVPVLLALVAIIVALGLTALLGQAFELSFFVVNMITAMGLALGIDYSLFVVSRYREERARGRERVAAIETCGATASRAVFFSGSAFVLALLGMVLVPDTILRSLAVGAILVGIVAVLAALTLLPAVLSLLGDRVNALRVPLIGRNVGREAETEGRFWGAVARTVMRRPGTSLVVATGLLLLAAAPVLDLRTGFNGISTLPDRFAAKQGFLALERSFSAGLADPAQIVIEGDVEGVSGPVTQDISGPAAKLERLIRADRRYGAVRRDSGPAGNLILMRVPLPGDEGSPEATAAVRHLRGELIPAAFPPGGPRALVGGATAEDLDYSALTERWLPNVFAFVLGLSFLLLTVAFRSVVLAGKAILLNLLSVGAAYGLLVLVFQKGVGAELLGFRQADSVEAWIPLFLFSVLFGLSMDYHVFLLSRIRERYLQTGDNQAAVAYGITSTAQLITGAALIIIVVFAGFAAGDLVMFQQMGFGIGVALFLDATVVRSVLVPAAMTLLGRWNWYLPAWLDWLPEVHVGEADEQLSTAPAGP